MSSVSVLQVSASLTVPDGHALTHNSVNVDHVLDNNVVAALNNVLKRHGGDLINLDAPITVDNVLNGNKVGVLNNVLKRHGDDDSLIDIDAPSEYILW